MHVGHARSFLLAWWSARSRGGRVVLRIEDIDAGRARPEFADACLEDLAWLGLDWDGPVLRQLDDTSALDEALEQLVAQDLVYPCVCSRSEIREAQSAPHAAPGAPGGEVRYAGTCRDRFASVAEAERATGRTAGLRFRVPPGELELHDVLHGTFRANVERESGDFLVARRDGAYGYHLAVVVDDARQGVTEVLRGDDLLLSCGRQRLLQDALGLPHPTWIHVPLVTDASGERLAKRSGGLTLAELRECGVDPRALVAWLARSCGLKAGSRAEPGDLLETFDLARLPRRGVPFGAEEVAELLREGAA